MKAKTTLNLVRNGALLYPQSDADYEVLSGLGIPLNNMSAEFQPALLTYLPSNIRPKIHKFDDLEEAMLGRFKAKWKHDASITAKAVILTYPKTIKEELLAKAIASLRKWYREHFIQLEETEKRGPASTRRLVLIKTLTPRREV